MFAFDLLIAFALMALLFLRQVAILKKPNKINYTPLILAIGTIAALIHFIIHPDPSDAILLVRESALPFLVALILYTIMNILNQTKESENAKLHDAFIKVLVEEIAQLKKFILDLETRMTEFAQEDRVIQQETRQKFKEDIKILDVIEKNQQLYMKQFDELFTHFSEVQMPELDSVVHKHIDILRIAEQDHYNKLTQLLQKAVESRDYISDDLESMHEKIESIKSLSDDVAKAIVEKTVSKLKLLTQEVEGEMLSLKLHTEGVKTVLLEDENVLGNIRTQSEMVMKQMLLSSNKMKEFEKQNEHIMQIYNSVKELAMEMESIKADYIKSQAYLTLISQELAESKDENLEEMKHKIDEVNNALSQKIEASLEKLYKHYHIANENITQSVELLTKKAKMYKGYTEFDEK